MEWARWQHKNILFLFSFEKERKELPYDPKTWIILFPLLLLLLIFFSSSYNFDLFIFLLELLSVFPGSCIVFFFLMWIYLFIIACDHALWPALISMGRADSLLDLAPWYVDGPGMIWCSLFLELGLLIGFMWDWVQWILWDLMLLCFVCLFVHVLLGFEKLYF